MYDERNKKTLTLEGHDPSDVDNNNIHDFATSNNNKQQQQDDEITPYITSTLSDNDSGVAADSYGISSNPPSTHTSLNSSSRPPRGIQRKFQQNKNASFRSSISSNSPTSSPELSRKNLKTPGFSRELNRKSLSSNHPMLYSWIDQQDRFNGGYFLVRFLCLTALCVQKCLHILKILEFPQGIFPTNFWHNLVLSWCCLEIRFEWSNIQIHVYNKSNSYIRQFLIHVIYLSLYIHFHSL